MAVAINTARRKKQFLVGTMCTKSPYYNERSTILSYQGKKSQVEIVGTNKQRNETKSKWNPVEAILKIKLVGYLRNGLLNNLICIYLIPISWPQSKDLGHFNIKNGG